jgi:hypothetical protein
VGEFERKRRKGRWRVEGKKRVLFPVRLWDMLVFFFSFLSLRVFSSLWLEQHNKRQQTTTERKKKKKKEAKYLRSRLFNAFPLASHTSTPTHMDVNPFPIQFFQKWGQQNHRPIRGLLVYNGKPPNSPVLYVPSADGTISVWDTRGRLKVEGDALFDFFFFFFFFI